MTLKKQIQTQVPIRSLAALAFDDTGNGAFHGVREKRTTFSRFWRAGDSDRIEIFQAS